MSRRPASKPNGLRAALAAKKIRTTHFDIPIEPSEKVDEIAGRLQRARQALHEAPYRGGTEQETKDAIETAQKAVEAAKAELDACFWRLELRGLPGDDDLDALLNAHPATEAQIAEAQAEIDKAKAEGKPKEEWPKVPSVDLDAFRCAYLAACAVNSDLTADEWREELWSDRWTPADRWNQHGTGIFNLLDQANAYAFSDGVEKG